MNKSEWVKMISDLLSKEKYSGVDFIYYTNETKNGWFREIVRIDYNCGSIAEINVTGNSLGLILHEIVREVYGDGAYGRVTKEWW